MDCVNHPGVTATAYCQSCGKALCAGCVRSAPGGQVLCEPCFAAWQTYQQPFVPISTGSPNPAAAAVLGLIPGVGAMYNGQFFKGLIHVVIFAVLVSMAHISGIFGIFIPAWILYQSFEAFHTAKALRDGLPVPDPLGLNDVGTSASTRSILASNPASPPSANPASLAHFLDHFLFLARFRGPVQTSRMPTLARGQQARRSLRRQARGSRPTLEAPTRISRSRISRGRRPQLRGRWTRMRRLPYHPTRPRIGTRRFGSAEHQSAPSCSSLWARSFCSGSWISSTAGSLNLPGRYS